jgi:hypothetical protein
VTAGRMLKGNGVNTARDAFLLTFGNGSSGVPADRIFRELIARDVWYFPKIAADLVQDSLLLFYQSGLGARGTASLVGVELTSEMDAPVLAELGLTGMKMRAKIRDAHEFVRPVALPPLVPELQFVGNKVHWGLYLRNTPRRIPIADYNLILSRAAE